MKLLRYRNPGEKELEQLQQEKKKSREKKSRESANFLLKIKRGNRKFFYIP